MLVDSGSASNLVRMQQALIWPWRLRVRDMGQFTVDLVSGPVTENCNVMRRHFCREPESQVS